MGGQKAMKRYQRYLYGLLGALLLASACVHDIPQMSVVDGDPFPEGKKVTITFSVPAPEERVGTKAEDGIGDEGKLNTLHVAVFGSSGYLKEYVKAMRLGEEGTGEWAPETYTYRDPYWNEGMTPEEKAKHEHIVPLIKYSATLSLSEKNRIIHFIGNGPVTLPYDADTTVMATLMSEGGEGGFWQIRRMERIGALKDAQGHYIDKDGHIIEDGTGYVPDDYTNAQLNKVPLVRNWAKISIVADDPAQSNFTPISFAIVNVPTKGTIAPLWKGNMGSLMFVEDYQDQTFERLSGELKYPASLPDEAIFDETIPDLDHFISADAAAFLYERPVPNEALKSTFVIVYGRFKDGNNYFYKVDLADGGYYYPIYRNFNYQIHITRIGSKGFSTPQGAAESVGGVDISSEVSTSHLGDISDGIAQLSVRPWMSRSFYMQQIDNNILSVKLLDDITTSPPHVNQNYRDSVFNSQPVTKNIDGHTVYLVSKVVGNDNPVTLEILPVEDGLGNVITDAFIAHPPVTGSDQSTAWIDGWRQIYFSTVAPESGMQPRTQTLRIKSSFIEGDVPRVFFRDVLITVLPRQQMKVSCLKPELENVIGAEQTLTILIPEGLPQSMFPLDFTIEPEAMSLMPKTGSNMPVVYGPTIAVPVVEKATGTFQFIRSLTYEEYMDPAIQSVKDPDNGSMWRPVVSEFVTTRTENATKIWVASDNFETNWAAFQNAAKKFRNLTIPSFELSDLQSTEYTFPIHFEVEESYLYGFPRVSLLTRGVTVVSDLPEATITNNGDGSVTYEYQATQEMQDIRFKLTGELVQIISETDGHFSIDISAREEDRYTPASVALRRFTDCRFRDGIWSKGVNLYSNVMFEYVTTDARNNGKAAPFGYRDDKDFPAVVTLKEVGTDKAFTYLYYPGNSSTGVPTVDNFPLTEVTYHEIPFKTKTDNTDPFAFRMVAPSYLTKTITAGRFSGAQAIGNYESTPVTNNSFNNNRKKASFSYKNDCKVEVEFDKTVKVENGNLKWEKPSSEATQTFTMSVKSITSGNKPLYYVEITFAEGSTVPDMSVNEGEGTISRYWGYKDTPTLQYIWNFPVSYSTMTSDPAAHTLTFTSSDDVKISKIIIRGIGMPSGANFVNYPQP